MKSTQSSGTRPVHQTVAGGFEIKTGSKAIAIGFTEQRLSPYAGSATFWGWLLGSDWFKRLGAALPHPPPLSNNNLLPLEKALAFIHGLLCEARKLTHVAYLRRDPVVPELIGIRRVASQSVLSRFFAGFDSAGAICDVFVRCGAGAWSGCPAPKKATRWIWILPVCCTRMDTSKEWRWDIPGLDSSRACIRFWPCWPKCA